MWRCRDMIYGLLALATVACGATAQEQPPHALRALALRETYELAEQNYETLDDSTYTLLNEENAQPTHRAMWSSRGPIVYRLCGGTDEQLFELQPQDGYAYFWLKNSPDFEAPTDGDLDSVYEVRVCAVDDDGDRSVNFRIEVVDLNEPPFLDPASTLPQGDVVVCVDPACGGFNPNVVNVTFLDPDAGDSVQYSVDRTAPEADKSAHFTVDEDTGAVTMVDDTDFAAATEAWGFRLVVNDTHGATVSRLLSFVPGTGV